MRTSTLLLILAACGGNGTAPAGRQATIEFFTAGPAGGTFTLPGGIEIELPPGAVSEPTEFRYEELDSADVTGVPAELGVLHAFRLLGRPTAPVAAPQLAMDDPGQFTPRQLLERVIIRARVPTLATAGGGYETTLAFLALLGDADLDRPLALQDQIVRANAELGGSRVEATTSEIGEFVVLFGIGTLEFRVVQDPSLGIELRFRKASEFDGEIGVTAGESTVTGGAEFTDRPGTGEELGRLIDENPLLAALLGLGCTSANRFDYNVFIRSTLDANGNVVNDSNLTRIDTEVNVQGSCAPGQSGDDRDGNWSIRLGVALLEEARLLPKGWLDSGEGAHLLTAYAEGITISSVFDAVGVPRTIGSGGLLGVLFGAFVIGEPPSGRSLSQVSQPSLQTVISYGSGGGFIRRYTAGQGFAPLSISLGAQFTDGGPMNNDPLSGIGVITNNIGNNIRLVSASATGAMPAGVPGQVTPKGFPAGTGKLFCTFMRTTAKTLVVTQGDPGAVWLIKDLFNAVVTKLADTQDDPRRIRVCGDIVVISNFGSNTLSIYRWNQDDTFTFIKHEPVCNGPVGFDLKKLTDGRVAIVSTGFFDHKYAITVVDPVQLTVKSGPCTALIAGCEDPGHAIWVPDEDEHRIVASCNGTENLASMAVTIPQ